MVICTGRVVKIKGHLSFCREFRTLCIEDRIVADHVVTLKKKPGGNLSEIAREAGKLYGWGIMY